MVREFSLLQVCDGYDGATSVCQGLLVSKLYLELGTSDDDCPILHRL